MLTRKLRKGDRIRFPPSSCYDPKRFPGFTGTITETHPRDGVVWYRDDATGESNCFIAHFHDGTFNILAEHIE
jgi:hypothetical protein